MNLLLDTHALIWYLEADTRLSLKARHIIEDSDNQVFVSLVTFYEMVIKIKIGKLPTHKKLSDFIKGTKKSLITIIPINEAQIIEYEQVPFYENHRDPFDRLLVATAISENLAVVTIDEKFDLYKDIITIIW